MDRADPRHGELIAKLLANPAEVDTLADDELVSQLLVEASMRHAQLANHRAVAASPCAVDPRTAVKENVGRYITANYGAGFAERVTTV
jgi:hypothetical protein